MKLNAALSKVLHPDNIETGDAALQEQLNSARVEIEQRAHEGQVAELARVEYADMHHRGAQPFVDLSRKTGVPADKIYGLFMEGRSAELFDRYGNLVRTDSPSTAERLRALERMRTPPWDRPDSDFQMTLPDKLKWLAEHRETPALQNRMRLAYLERHSLPAGANPLARLSWLERHK
jgi:hypothetical protein